MRPASVLLGALWVSLVQALLNVLCYSCQRFVVRRIYSVMLVPSFVEHIQQCKQREGQAFCCSVPLASQDGFKLLNGSSWGCDSGVLGRKQDCTSSPRDLLIICMLVFVQMLAVAVLQGAGRHTPGSTGDQLSKYSSVRSGSLLV